MTSQYETVASTPFSYQDLTFAIQTVVESQQRCVLFLVANISSKQMAVIYRIADKSRKHLLQNDWLADGVNWCYP